MKQILWLGVLALPLCFLPRAAHAEGLLPPIEVDAGVKAWFNCRVLDWHSCARMGPWYLYWPYEAHFQNSAPFGQGAGWPGPMKIGRAHV